MSHKYLNPVDPDQDQYRIEMELDLNKFIADHFPRWEWDPDEIPETYQPRLFLHLILVLSHMLFIGLSTIAFILFDDFQIDFSSLTFFFFMAHAFYTVTLSYFLAKFIDGGKTQLLDRIKLFRANYYLHPFLNQIFIVGILIVLFGGKFSAIPAFLMVLLIRQSLLTSRDDWFNVMQEVRMIGRHDGKENFNATYFFYLSRTPELVLLENNPAVLVSTGYVCMSLDAGMADHEIAVNISAAA